MNYNIFNEAHLNQLKHELLRRKADIGVENGKAIRHLTNVAKEIVQRNIVEMNKKNDKSTGELYDSVEAIFDEATNTGTVTVHADHALYVEYGTGVMGEWSQHPEPPASWVYNTREGSGKDAGWWWKDRNGAWHYTLGQPAYPFFYNAKIELEERKAEIVKEVLNQ